MLTFNDLFEELLEKHKVDVAVAGSQAEVLRSSLSRRWSKYKKTYDSLGFLDDELKDLALTAKATETGTQYALVPNNRRISYQILEAPNE